MNFALALAANRMNGVTVQWTDQPAQHNATLQSVSAPNEPNAQALQTPINADSDEARLESVLVSGGISDTTRTAVLDQFAQQNTANMNPRRAATAAERQHQLLAGLLLGSPEFQRR
jgi:hypothetical protein